MPSRSQVADMLRDLYSQAVKQMAVEGTALAQGNGYGDNPDAVNAIVHTYASAIYAYYCGDDVAKVFGDIKEIPSDPEYYADSLRDQYNNEVGRQIAEWAKENGYGLGDSGDSLLNHRI